MKKILLSFSVILAAASFIACSDNIKDPVRYIDETNNGYETSAVAEVLVKSCAASGCHSGANPAGKFSTENYYSLIKGVSDPVNINQADVFEGELLIPYNSQKSLLYQMIMGNVTPISPHDALTLTSAEKNTIKNWIDNGAKNFNKVVPSSDPSYRVFVCNQSSDFVSVIDGDKNVVGRIKDVSFGSNIDAPHMVKEYGDYYYVTLISAGKFLKIRKSDNQIVGETSGIEKAGMIQITPDGTKAFVSRSSSSASIYNTVYAIKLSDMSIINEINLPVTGVPHALALSPDGTKLFVANLTKDRLSIVDAVNDEFMEDVVLPLGTGPMETTISPDGRYVYISGMNSSKLLVYDVFANSVVSEINVSPMPMHIAVSSNGNKIYVATMMMNAVNVIEKNGTIWTKTGEITHLKFNLLHGCDLTPDDKYLYVSSRNVDGTYQPKFKVAGEGNNGSLGIINTETLQVVKVIDLEEFPSGLTVEKK